MAKNGGEIETGGDEEEGKKERELYRAVKGEKKNKKAKEG